jgi:putative endonuclease
MFYVYILKLSNNQLYTGSTEDLNRRLLEHKNGKVRSTEHRRPLALIHYEVYKLKSDALRREKYLKKSEGKLMLRRQIRDLLTIYKI